MRFGAFLLLLASLLVTRAAFGQAVAKRLSFDDVVRTAADRASRPLPKQESQLPEAIRGDKLNYDSYREIQFRHEKALWLNEELPFRLEFYHPGYLYQTPVKLYEFNTTHVQPIRFAQDFFNYGKLHFRIPADTGYAGFKLLYRLNNSNRWDEVASFLGSSYFRCLGRGQSYGLSARGLAINCGEPERPEEFPVFTQWWLGKPETDDATLHLYALLESQSCAGAYDFLLRPGESTIMDIEAVLHFRAGADGTNELRTIGLAPLTSMFWFGENSTSRPDDYRPEVHDSDGLLIAFGTNQFTWCPLQNPPQLQHRRFPGKDIRGFGLLQRDRKFADYQDLFNPYHRAPSVWVEPRGQWGSGEVHLVQLNATQEGTDNIAAFWNPETRPEPLKPYRFAYTLHWANEPEAKAALLKVVQTRSGHPARLSERQFVVDFSGESSPLAAGGAPELAIRCTEGATASNPQVFRNELGNGWRAFFSIKPDPEKKDPIDIQCWLHKGEDPLSETWSYLWNPSLQNQ